MLHFLFYSVGLHEKFRVAMIEYRSETRVIVVEFKCTFFDPKKNGKKYKLKNTHF